MTPHALLFTIAAIGISEVVYLIRSRRQGKKPVCPIGNTCQVVLESKYNRLFGIPNDILGLLFYAALSVITAVIVIGIGSLILLDLAVKLLVGLGTLMSLLLLFLQWKVIKAWCFWCVMSAITVFLMGIIVLTAKLI